MEITNIESQNPIPDIQIPVLPSTPTPNKKIFKILFFIFLGLFLIISSIYLYLWVKSDQQPQNSKTATNNVTSTPSSTSAQVIINNSNSLKQVLTDWSLYREIGGKGEPFYFYNSENEEEKEICNTWFCEVPPDNKLYSFAQKILNGSIKEFTIGVRSVYITPNYENYSNQEFTNLDIEPFVTGLGEIRPLYALSDKLIWSNISQCNSGVLLTDPKEKENEASCEYLEKLIGTAFEQ